MQVCSFVDASLREGDGFTFQLQILVKGDASANGFCIIEPYHRRLKFETGRKIKFLIYTDEHCFLEIN